MRRSLAVILATFALNAFSNPEKPVTQIETGPIQGTTEYNMNVFKNIPYAAPPVGDLRWRPPQPVASWSGTRDASKFGDTCPQPNLKNENRGLGLPGNEDCLNLNVFTPQNAGKDLPVMVCIDRPPCVIDWMGDGLVRLKPGKTGKFEQLL